MNQAITPPATPSAAAIWPAFAIALTTVLIPPATAVAVSAQAPSCYGTLQMSNPRYDARTNTATVTWEIQVEAADRRELLYNVSWRYDIEYSYTHFGQRRTEVDVFNYNWVQRLRARDSVRRSTEDELFLARERDSVRIEDVTFYDIECSCGSGIIACTSSPRQ